MRSPLNHRLRRAATAALVTWLAIALCTDQGSCQGSSTAAGQFVGRKGTNFVLDGKTFFVAGVNNHYLTYGSPSEVVRVLDDAVAMNANVVRTFIQPVIGSLDGTSMPTIWDWKSKAEASNLGVNGTYMLYWDSSARRMAINDGPDGLQRLDFLLAEARKRSLKLIIAFLDFWPYTGGAQQIRSWYGSKDVYEFFARDPRTVADFKAWIRSVLTRVNSIDGIPYVDDPTVFAWELMNEPDIHPASLLRAWIADISSFVKALDRNHLVATGHGNLYDKFSDVEIDTIDFGTWHGYPIHNKVTPKVMNRMIGHFCAIGKRYDKPMLWEEFGWARSNRDQAEVYRMWLDTLHANDSCAGWVVWRLVSLQESGRYPVDDHDQFDIRNDGSATWNVLSDKARALRAKAGLVR
jgi:mannan endo-1,4-beta-mannosidase